MRYSCLASPSSLNATLKDEQKLASGDFWSRDICCFSCSRPRHWRGKRRRRSSKLPALEVKSYHFHSGHVEPTGGLRVELIPVCIVVEASRLHISLETSSSASAASCGPSWVSFLHAVVGRRCSRRCVTWQSLGACSQQDLKALVCLRLHTRPVDVQQSSSVVILV